MYRVGQKIDNLLVDKIHITPHKDNLNHIRTSEIYPESVKHLGVYVILEFVDKSTRIILTPA
jgi:hypothetical protein